MLVFGQRQAVLVDLRDLSVLGLLLEVPDEDDLPEILVLLSGCCLVDQLDKQPILPPKLVQNEPIILDLLSKVDKLNEPHNLLLEMHHDLQYRIVRILLGIEIIKEEQPIQILLGQTLPDMLADCVAGLLDVLGDLQDCLYCVDVVQVGLLVGLRV